MQRQGKYQSKEPKIGGFGQVNFFKIAKELLEANGEEDAAFYFEQMEDYLRSGKQLPTDEREITRALGI